MSDSFGFPQLVELCHQTHQEMQRRAGYAVDSFLVVRNWLFGRYIVEFEQRGADRAEHGRRLIPLLAMTLNGLGIKGVSTTNLKQCRSFYLSCREIGQTVSDPSGALPAKGQTLSDLFPENRASAELTRARDLSVLSRRFPLGWSHYVALLTIDNPEERRFYEIEAGANAWSVRELERQIASSLYQRLALSRDKDAVRRLAREGQVVEKPADYIHAYRELWDSKPETEAESQL